MSQRASWVITAFIVIASFGFAACNKTAEQPAAPAAQQQAAMQDGGGAAPQGGAEQPGMATGHQPIVAMPAGNPHEGGTGGSPHGMLTWDVPASWTQERPSNQMRMAQYRVPATAGDPEDGECVVFYFGPGQGGDAASNVSRWLSMFTTPQGGAVEGKVTEQKLGERLVTRIEASGTYQPTSMMMGGPPPAKKPGSMMLGAIVPGADANWFFRCIGPEKTISANRAAFDGFITSIK